MGRLRNFKTGTPIEHALYQLPCPAIKTYEVGFLHAGGGIPCRPHPVATQLVCIFCEIFFSNLKSMNTDLIPHGRSSHTKFEIPAFCIVKHKKTD